MGRAGQGCRASRARLGTGQGRAHDLRPGGPFSPVSEEAAGSSPGASRGRRRRKRRFCAGRAGWGSTRCPERASGSKPGHTLQVSLRPWSHGPPTPSAAGAPHVLATWMNGRRSYTLTSAGLSPRAHAPWPPGSGPWSVPTPGRSPDSLCFPVPVPAACTASRVPRRSSVARRVSPPAVRLRPGAMPAPVHAPCAPADRHIAGPRLSWAAALTSRGLGAGRQRMKTAFGGVHASRTRNQQVNDQTSTKWNITPRGEIELNEEHLRGKLRP